MQTHERGPMRTLIHQVSLSHEGVVADSALPPAIARFAEPLAMTSVYPYLPEMIKSFGIPENNVARWAGLVGSTFSISQSLFAVPWGRLSDSIGRKPSIVIGLTVTMILFLVWGTASSLTMALVVRALMGAGNGNGTFLLTWVPTDKD